MYLRNQYMYEKLMETRVSNRVLLAAALKLMRNNGYSLTDKYTAGRSNIYEMSDGQTVRVRTSNDPILVVLAEAPEPDAKLNIQGTDWLLFVMLEKKRTEGNIIGYLVPTQKAVNDVREAQQNWLSTRPNTKGNNRTWNIWFDESGRKTSNRYAEKWVDYRLEGTVSTHDVAAASSPSEKPAFEIGQEIAAMQARIARGTGLPPNFIKVSIEIVPAPAPSVA